MDEPYLQSMLQRYQKDQYNSLRDKLGFIVPVRRSRIYSQIMQTLTDVQKSRYVYGIVDELGELNDEQVYVYISGVGTILGDILVTR